MNLLTHSPLEQAFYSAEQAQWFLEKTALDIECADQSSGASPGIENCAQKSFAAAQAHIKVLNSLVNERFKAQIGKWTVHSCTSLSQISDIRAQASCLGLIKNHIRIQLLALNEGGIYADHTIE